MNDINAVLAGSIEDKWVEFVADEFAQRRGKALRGALAAGTRATDTMRRIEVHAGYVWLLAGAMVAWLIG
jgi:hypothetical protein